MTKNKINVSGITSSSINIQSPLASAIVELDKKGASESARAIVGLADLLESGSLDDTEKKDLKDLLEAIVEEARRPQARKATLKALGSQLSVGVASSAIADEAAPLIDMVSRLWQ